MRILKLMHEVEDGQRVFIYEAIDPSKDEKIYLRLPPEFENKKPIEAKIWTWKVLWDEYEKTKKIPEFVCET